MENIYKLTDKMQELDFALDNITSELEETYEANGGEVTAETEEREAVRKQLEALKQEVIATIIDNADDYAEIALNKRAQRNILEAQMKALKEEQAKQVARLQTKITHLEHAENFWKESFALAMNIQNIEKIGGPKTDHKYSIYFKNTESIDVDEEKVLAPYEEKLDEVRNSLPAWLQLKAGVSKAELKKEESLPDGACIVSNQSIQIR